MIATGQPWWIVKYNDINFMGIFQSVLLENSVISNKDWKFWGRRLSTPDDAFTEMDVKFLPSTVLCRPISNIFS